MKSAKLSPLALALAFVSLATVLLGQGGEPNFPGAHDPGVRAGAVNAGLPLSSLSAAESQFFQDGQARFVQVDSVGGTISGEPGSGLGPTFNSNSCGSCHAQPATGGSSPSANQYPNVGPNPQIAAANDAGATNTIPFFVRADGPVREARFPFLVNPNGTLSQIPDGGVHDLFTIAGRTDATNVVGVTVSLKSAPSRSRTSRRCGTSATSSFAYPHPYLERGLSRTFPMPPSWRT